jgi:hypothetical protein
MIGGVIAGVVAGGVVVAVVALAWLGRKLAKGSQGDG